MVRGAQGSDDPQTLRYDIGSSAYLSLALDAIMCATARRSRSRSVVMVRGRNYPASRLRDRQVTSASAPSGRHHHLAVGGADTRWGFAA